MLDGPGQALSELGIPSMGGEPAAIFGAPPTESAPRQDPRVSQSATELPRELMAALMDGQRGGGRARQERSTRHQGPPRAPRGLPQSKEAQMAMLQQMLAQGGEAPMPVSMKAPQHEKGIEPPAIERFKVDPKVHELLDKPVPDGPIDSPPKKAEQPKISTWGELIKYVWNRIKTSFTNFFK